MILPGISGSYLLLLFGLYETVIGSLSRDELLGNTAASLAILAPVGVGAALGIGLLSNGLKRLLERSSRATHGALMGLLLGSVLGLWPFQEPVSRLLGRTCSCRRGLRRRPTCVSRVAILAVNSIRSSV